MFLIFCCWALGMILGLIFDGFLVDFGVENRSKINQKSIQKPIETKMQVGMDFGSLLDRFLIDFGPKLEAKLGPSWHQNSKNGGSKMVSKKVMQKSHARNWARVGPGWCRPLKNN